MRKENRSRALRNIAIVLILAVLIWAIEGFDLPTMEMELHRSERQHMMDESRIIWKYEGKMYNDRDIIVGLGSEYISTRAESGHGAFWPRAADEPTLVMLPNLTRYNPAGTAHSYLDPSLILVDAPSRTQSARLHILLEYNEFSEVYTVEGEKQGPVWFFQLERRYYALSEDSTEEERQRSYNEESALNFLGNPHPDHFYYPCTVEFFDKDGGFLSALELNGGAEPT